MAEIIKVNREHLPALRLIGKRYTNADRIDGGFGGKWGEWFQNGWFNTLERLGEAQGIENGYLGFMRCDTRNCEQTFEYWIGMFFPPGTAVPSGYASLDAEEGSAAVCWIKGKEEDGSIFNMHDACLAKLQSSGMGDLKTDGDNRACFFERYNCPRFTEKDVNGNVILDYGVYLA